MHLIDAGAWDKARSSSTSGRAGELAYVIVADSHEPRIAACLAALKPYNLGVLVARNGEEALGLLRRFGAPILLVVDLSLPAPDGFAVIEAARQGGRTEVIAWSSLRGLREFAIHRLRGDHVHILSGSAGSAVIQKAIERALRARGDKDQRAASRDPVDEMMSALAAKARALCRTAGAAVYLKASGEAEFRTVVRWDCDEPIPHSQAELPRVFDWIQKTGEALVLPDLSRHRASGVPMLRLRDSLRGLVAVPIVSPEQQTIGMLCVFDLRPFRFDGADIDALKSLGRGVSTGARTQITVEAPPPRSRDLQPVAATVEAPVVLSAPANASAPIALLDRRDGNLAIARELARVRREQRHLSVILFDVDSVVATTEPVRESQGDPVATVAETLTGAVRGSDLAIKWSREELLLVLAGLNAAEARRVAERVRAAMQAGARQPVAVSGGVAELLAEDTFESVMARADQQARLAKARGHNRVS